MGRVLGLAIALAGAAAGVGDERRAPAPTIQGKWEVTAARFNGAECPAPKGCTLAAGEQEVMIYDEGVQVRTLSYALDPKVNPPRIDLVRDGTGAKALGIQSVDKDELRICYSEPGASRPAGFESKRGSRVFPLVLKRVSK